MNDGDSKPPLSRGRLALRAAIILLTMLTCGLRWLGGFCVLLVLRRGKARRQAWFGHMVLTLFRELGATFIKVGQIMSTRPDLLPDHVTRALEHLQDDVGPFPFQAVEQTLR